MATLETLEERIRETERTIMNAKKGNLKNPVDISDYETYLNYLKQKRNSKQKQLSREQAKK
ncbi:hypothetical protein MHI18_21435 [Peribacillus sp. FSL H8-0477]|uniref:hypothetical protein n=1 Tax=Peribacillus sp. FSL H8-0477 TaxID=2921388 RepID=UPI0030FA8FE9